MRVSINTVTFPYNGGERSITYESNPMPVYVQSKPSWVDVSFHSNVTHELPNTFRELDYDIETRNGVQMVRFNNTGSVNQNLTRMENRIMQSPSLSAKFNEMETAKNLLNENAGTAKIKRSIGGTRVLEVVRTTSVVIKTNSNNYTRTSRTGFVVLSNGVKTASIRVTQNASRTIVIGHFDPNPIRPIRIEREGDNPFEIPFLSYKEVVPNTLYISTGSIEKTANNVDDMTLYAKPVINATRGGVPPDGGVITCDTVDGETSIQHYNTGDVMEKRQVKFQSDGHCVIELTIDGNTFTVGEGDVYYEELQTGVEITASVTASSGYIWSHWSDDDENATRTFTVADDDIILTAYTESEEDLLQYDDSVDVAWDDGTTVSLKDDE